ncbi:hypothetical protein HZC07_05135, partial [Candidatus Micrarchaeota archaeon]|nr:hypothetical protein [Candidatus Micrarchaeota archaeon]
ISKIESGERRLDVAEMKKFADFWKKKKAIPKNMAPVLVNLITSTSSLNGVFIAKTINLPAPVIPLAVQTK